MLPGHAKNLPSPGRTTKHWGKHFQNPCRFHFFFKFIFKNPRMRRVGGDSLARSVHRRRRRDEGIYAPKCWKVMEKLRSRNKNKRGENKFLLVVAFSALLEEIMEQIGSIYTIRQRFGLVYLIFFLQGFMLNLLVAGVSRGQGWSRTRADFSL